MIDLTKLNKKVATLSRFLLLGSLVFTFTACAPEDPEIIEDAIKRALISEELVNSAAKKNYDCLVKNADYEKLKSLTVKSYQTIFDYKNR